MGLFQKKEAAQLPPPRHIAIIMDGNGRWARKRGLPRTAGHAAGAESFRRIANYCGILPYMPFPQRTGSAPRRRSAAL